jgi:hypothetical protein
MNLSKKIEKKHALHVYVTIEEQQTIEELKKALGLTWPELARKCILKETELKLVSSKSLLNALDSAGENLARSGQDIHQLAAWVATQTREGHFAAQTAEKFDRLMRKYIRSQKSLEAAIRLIVLRALKAGG